MRNLPPVAADPVVSGLSVTACSLVGVGDSAAVHGRAWLITLKPGSVVAGTRVSIKAQGNFSDVVMPSGLVVTEKPDLRGF